MKLKWFSTSFTFIGALIGAGFVSGREIALYFGHTSIFTPILAGVFLGAFCYLFLQIGRITCGNPADLLQKGKPVMEAVVRLSNVVTCCAMVAGSEEAIFALFHFHGGGIITSILCLVVVGLGSEKIKLSNFLIVPAIIIMIAVLFFKGHTVPVSEKMSVYPAFTYCTMNVISGGYLVSTYSADFNKKDCAVVSAISGTLLMAILLAVFFVIQNNLDAVMPLMATAEVFQMAKLGYVILYLSIFTTLVTSLSVAAKNRIPTAIIVTAASLLAATVGFEKIVNNCYPIIGAVGGAVCIIYLILYLKRHFSAKIPLNKFLKQRKGT